MAAFWAAAVTALLLFHAWRAPWLLAKPGVQFIAAANVVLQWPMALFGDQIFAGVSAPSWVALVVALPLLAGLGWMPFVAGPAMLQVIAKARAGATEDRYITSSSRALLVLWLVTGVVVGWYLWSVPFRQTGLYAIVAQPSTAALAREESLKLLDNRVLAYTYLSIALVVCPVIAALSLRIAIASVRRRRFVVALAMFSSLVAAVAFASLSGARSLPARALLVVILSRWFEGGMRVRATYLVALPLVLGVPVALMSIMREGRSVDSATVLFYVGTAVRERVFVTPAKVGAQHLRYAEAHSAFGVRAVPRLAVLFGERPSNPANIVGRQYDPYAIPTINANASFLFTYVSYFGTIAVLVNIVLVLILELLIPVLKRTGATMMAPTLATLCVANMGFLSFDYSTALLSGGVLSAAALSLGITWLLREGADVPSSA